MLHAEFDPIQIAIVVIAMVVGFLQWLWKVIKQGAEEAKRENIPVDPEAKRLRDEAWRRQIQQQQTPAPLRSSPTATPPPLSNDPWSSVRDVFEKMKEEMRKSQGEGSERPRNPPPLPPRPATPSQFPQAQRPVASPAPPEQRPVETSLQPQRQFNKQAAYVPVPAHSSHALPPTVAHRVRATIVPRATAARPQTRVPRPDFEGLRGFLMDPESIRRAILIKEVLGPPKSLQSS